MTIGTLAYSALNNIFIYILCSTQYNHSYHNCLY